MEKVNEKLGGLKGVDLSDLCYNREEFEKEVIREVAYNKGKIEISKSMLKEKFNIETIMKLTGLTKEEIESL